MQLSIIGAGNVGSTLGRRWIAAGHQVIFGVRDPADPKTKDLPAGGRTATATEAITGTPVVVLTLPWDAVPGVLQAAGDLSGKVLIDVTNPIALGVDGLKKGLQLGHTTSGAEQVAAWAPGARVVKTFNQTGWPNMADPNYNGVPASMFYCGDDPEAKAMAAKLGADLGFEMLDAGPLSIARLLEPLAMLWIHMALFQQFGTSFAFQVVRR